MELKRQMERYTYADYKQWNGRWEIIDGRAYAMAPAPSIGHQSISGMIFRKLGDFLDGKPCMPFIAPLDVRFEESDGCETVVQPDVLVVCDRAKLRKDGCVGTPEVVFEVLSPSTATRDLLMKYDLYERHGVREYWVVDPIEKVMVRFTLKDGRYERSGEQPVLESLVLPGFSLEPAALFASLADLPMDEPK